MEKEVLDKLEELIEEANVLINNFKLVSTDYLGNNKYKINNYQLIIEWQDASEYLIKKFIPDCNFQQYLEYDDEYEYFRRLFVKLKSIKRLGGLKVETKLSKDTIDKAVNISLNNTNTQFQSQSQELIVSIFNEAIKDELTGKQLKEIKEILEVHEEEPEKAKSKVMEKLKSFGSDVLSNVLANIISNPAVWGCF